MANPLMNEKMFEKVGINNNDSMTLQGTINKTFILLWITVFCAIMVWNNAVIFSPFLVPIIIISFILAMVIIFFKKTASYLSPVYAILEWWTLWVISLYYEAQLPWIVIQAVALTFWVFLIMLSLYKFQIIQVTENFKTGVIASTGAIALIYLISILWWLTGWFDIPFIHEWGFLWILFSLFVVWIASFNLILDFDNVEMWVQMKAPKYMEWYTSFSLLITLIWLYLEILRLLSKLNKE